MLAATLPLWMMGAVVMSGPAAGASAQAGAPVQYHIVNLGGLGGDGFGQATALNDRGDVVGFSRSANGSIHPFLWRHGVMTDLGALEPGQAETGIANDVNNLGWVVGNSDAASGYTVHGFLWRDGKMTDLGTLGGAYSTAEAVNDRGQIVGTSSTADGSWHPFLWENGQMRQLPMLTVTDINNAGQMIGTDAFPSGYHEYLAFRGKITELGNLPGATGSYVRAINNRGWVVGDNGFPDGTHAAYLWRNGRAFELPGLDSTYSTAVSLNDRGQVIGRSANEWRPVLWQNGTVIDLTTRGIPLGNGTDPATVLLDINNSGQIAGGYPFTEGMSGPALFVP